MEFIHSITDLANEISQGQYSPEKAAKLLAECD